MKKQILSLIYCSTILFLSFSCQKSDDFKLTSKEYLPEVKVQDTKVFKSFVSFLPNYRVDKFKVTKEIISNRTVFFVSIPFIQSKPVPLNNFRVSSDSIIETRYEFTAAVDSSTGFIFGVMNKYEITSFDNNNEPLNYILTEYVEPTVDVVSRTFENRTLMTKVNYSDNLQYIGPPVNITFTPGWWELTTKCYKELQSDCAGVIPCDMACQILPCKTVHLVVCGIRSFFESI